MKKVLFKSMALLLSCGNFIFPGYSQSTGRIYDSRTLSYWQAKYQVSSAKILNQLIVPRLTYQESARLSQVRLYSPTLTEISKEPFGYFRQGNTITLSTHSLKFADDVFIAYAWITLNRSNLSPVTDYFASLHYATSGTRARSPHQVMRIPSNVLNNQEVNNLSLHYFNSFRTFIIAHELGHIYYNHKAYKDISPALAREQERQADRFALGIMRRLQYFPLGTALFFQWGSHANWNAVNTTHPVDAERLAALALGLRKGARDFAKDRRLGDVNQGIYQINWYAAKFDSLAMLLRDKELNMSLQIPNQYGTGRISRATLSYQGTYTRIINHGREEEHLPAEVNLVFRGSAVSGTFDFGMGKGEIYDGVRKGNEISFYWKYYNASGKGRLHILNGGQNLRGTWGYYKEDRYSSTNGGRWDLRRK